MSPKRGPRNISVVDPNSFGGVIRRARMDAGMSQEELGDVLGTDQARVSAYENNKFKPNEDNLIDVARALKLAPGLLFEASQWGGLLPVGTDRRKRLLRIHEHDWQVFDPVIEALIEATPQERTTLAQDLQTCLASWQARRQDRPAS